MKKDDIFQSEEFRAACEEYCEKLVAETMQNEPETHEFSAEFEEKMSKLLEKPHKGNFKVFNTIGKRVAVAVVALALTLTTVLSVKALRIPIIKFFVNIYEEFTSLFVDSSNADYNDNFIFTPKEPTYTVDGFEVDKSIVYDNVYQVNYIYDGISNYYYKQNRLYQNQQINTHTADDIIYENGLTLYYYHNEQHNKLIWYDNQYSYMISGEISKEEMVKVAQSVK